MSAMPTPPFPGGSVCYIKAQFVLRADDFSGIFTLVKEDFFFLPLVSITALLLLLCWPICAPFSLVLTHVHRVVRAVCECFSFLVRDGPFCFPG